MNTLAGLHDLQLGHPISVGNLTLVPLLTREVADATYLTLDEAIAEHLAQVTEISEEGSVGQLRVKNDAKRPVLILDGEELVGAKQNRIVNLTILVAAESVLEIPVTCVEAGRWRHRSKSFSTAGRAHYASARAMKLGQVSESMAIRGTRGADQHAVWAHIADKSARMRAFSDTQAAAAMYEQAETALEEFVRVFEPSSVQVGAIFAIGGSVAGFEAFDSPHTWRKQAHKVIRSYGLDAIDRAGETNAHSRTPSQFIEGLASLQMNGSPALGLGTDIRFGSADIVGAALVVDDRLVHAVAFPAGA